MGWYIVDGGRKIFHGGANETFRTEVTIYLSRDRAYVLLSNEGHQVDHFISASQLSGSGEALVLGKIPPPVSQGWSVRWMGWVLGILVLALIALHPRNLLGLRSWSERTRNLPPLKRALDLAISIDIPTVILIVVFSLIKAVYGDRFILWTNIAYMRLGLPDVFILLLVGIVPDYIQGGLKLSLWHK